MSQDTDNILVKALLWLVFIPAGFIGGVIAGIFTFTMLFVTSWLAGAPTEAPINYIITACISGYAAVYAAVYIAPTKIEKHPASCITALMIILGVIAIYTRAENGEWFRSLEGACILAGTFVAALQASNNKLL